MAPGTLGAGRRGCSRYWGAGTPQQAHEIEGDGSALPAAGGSYLEAEGASQRTPLGLVEWPPNSIP